MNKYVLDTSALFAFIEGENGHETVRALLLQALDEKAEIFISIISCIELYYVSLREQNKKIAVERLELLKDLPVTQQSLRSELTNIIGEIKATQKMSFADCCIAGLAKFTKATLIHKDPEFEQVEKIIHQIKLPYKKQRRSKK